MKTKLFFLFLFSILLIGSVSALTVFPTNDFQINPHGYGTANIKNFFGIGGDLMKVTLTDNTNYCMINCSAQGTAELYQSASLLDNVYFKNLKNGKDTQVNYKIYLQDGTVDGKQQIQTCSDNQIYNSYNKTYSLVKNCKSDYVNIQVPNWVKYNGQNLNPGNYTWRIEGQKGIYDSVDWIGSFSGVKVNQWAGWNSSFQNGLNMYFPMQSNLTDVLNGQSFTQVAGSSVFNATAGINQNGVYIDVGNKINLPYNQYLGNQNYTINFWINNLGTAAGYVIAANIGGDYIQENGGVLRWTVCDTASGLAPIVVGNKYMFTIVRNSSGVTCYLNGTQDASTATTTHNLSSIGFPYQSSNAGDKEYVDEVMFYNRSLATNEITDLYNAGAGIFYNYQVFFPIRSILNSPINYYNSSSNLINFNCSATSTISGGLINNISLWVNGQRNYTIINGVTNFSELDKSLTLGEGSNNWTCSADDNEIITGTGFATNNYTVTIDTTPDIHFISPTPLNASNLSTSNIPINISLTETYFKNLTFYLFNADNSLNRSITFTDNTRFYNFTSVGDGNWSINATTGTTTGRSNSTETRNYFIDATLPSISITNPLNQTYTTNYSTNSTISIDLNATITDPHLQACWIYNGTANVTVTCGQNLTINTEYGAYQFIFYANDTFGNTASSPISANWNYQISQNSISYNSSTSVGLPESFILNISLNNSYSILNANLIYNGTSYLSSQNVIGSNVILSNKINVPVSAISNNYTFFWSFNSGAINSTSYQQQVYSILIDNCSTYTNLLLNLTLKDEKTKNLISGGNTTINSNILISSPNGVLLSNFSNSVVGLSNSKFCLQSNLSNSLLSGTINYFSDGYVTRNYNLQNLTISNITVPYNIGLFDLDSATGVKFLIAYKNSQFVSIPNAILHINRKYTSSGMYTTVSAPKTDLYGQTEDYFDLGGAIYSIEVYQNNILLSTFNDISIFCQPNIQQCTLPLYATGSTVNIQDFTQTNGIYYSFYFNKTSNTITSSFSSADGTSKNYLLNVTQFDNYGNKTICASSVITSTGSLQCAVPTTLGNITITSTLYADGVFIGNQVDSITANPKNTFGNNIFLYIFLLILTFPLMLISSPIGIIIGGVVGIIMSFLIFGLGGTIIGASSLLIWLVISVIIIIYKIHDRGGG